MPCRASRAGSRASWTSSASATAPTSRARSRRSRWATRIPIELLLPDGVDLKIDKQTHLVLSGLRPAAAGPGGGEHPRAAQAGSLQEQGRPLHGRGAAQEGRQDRGGCANDSRSLKRTKSASAFTSASGASCRARRSGRAWRCSAAWRTSTRRSSTTWQGRHAGVGVVRR